MDVSSGWHHHPGEEVGYIVAGKVRMEREDATTQILIAGDGFLIPPGVPHNATDLGPDTGEDVVDLHRGDGQADRNSRALTAGARFVRGVTYERTIRRAQLRRVSA
ncbi:cupin domain-containing protein [Microbacterium sp. DT81.1]|uniref:cupin domain-containing protein n=1 Tax=Microbacterium sp. DT81.1 TaxID=3393413 RepID=UPI003CF395A5